MGTPAALHTDEQPAFDFIAEVMKTASPMFKSHRISGGDLLVLLRRIQTDIALLDVVKKALFYDRKVGDGPKEISPMDAKSIGIDSAKAAVYPIDLGSLPINIFHAIVGSVTEAGEKLDIVLNSLMFGDAFDRTNYIEEVGDGLYYDGLGLDTCGVTFEEAMEIVIKKLRLRSGTTFSATGFNDRNTDTERQLLEEATTDKTLLPDEDKTGRVKVEKTS